MLTINQINLKIRNNTYNNKIINRDNVNTYKPSAKFDVFEKQIPPVSFGNIIQATQIIPVAFIEKECLKIKSKIIDQLIEFSNNLKFTGLYRKEGKSLSINTARTNDICRALFHEISLYKPKVIDDEGINVFNSFSNDIFESAIYPVLNNFIKSINDNLKILIKDTQKNGQIKESHFIRMFSHELINALPIAEINKYGMQYQTFAAVSMEDKALNKMIILFDKIIELENLSNYYEKIAKCLLNDGKNTDITFGKLIAILSKILHYEGISHSHISNIPKELLKSDLEYPYRTFESLKQIIGNAHKYNFGKPIKFSIITEKIDGEDVIFFSCENVGTTPISEKSIDKILEGNAYRARETNKGIKGTGEGLSFVIKCLEKTKLTKYISSLIERNRKPIYSTHTQTGRPEMVQDAGICIKFPIILTDKQKQNEIIKELQKQTPMNPILLN